MQSSLLVSIKDLKHQAAKLKIIQQTELLIREIQLVYQTMQKVGYSYDFNSRKILDPLTLSISLKQLGVLSKEAQDRLKRDIPEVAHKLGLLADV